MAKAMKMKQLSFSLPNRIGMLSELSSFLTAAKINIEAICAYGMGDEGYFMIVTDNNTKAKKVISQMGANEEGLPPVTSEKPPMPHNKLLRRLRRSYRLNSNVLFGQCF
jgi:formyltetrahydrofolate hydrolase